jgi:hypothetical protein
LFRFNDASDSQVAVVDATRRECLWARCIGSSSVAGERGFSRRLRIVPLANNACGPLSLPVGLLARHSNRMNCDRTLTGSVTRNAGFVPKKPEEAAA